MGQLTLSLGLLDLCGLRKSPFRNQCDMDESHLEGGGRSATECTCNHNRTAVLG